MSMMILPLFSPALIMCFHCNKQFGNPVGTKPAELDNYILSGVAEDLMKRSTLIATCLVKSEMIARLEYAEQCVRQTFLSEFPNSSFSEWNHDINEGMAEDIIRRVGPTSRINVKKFIEDLWYVS
jgi:hypothetical protein